MEQVINCCNEQNKAQKTTNLIQQFKNKITVTLGRTNLLIMGLFLGIGIIIPHHLLDSVEFTGKALISLSPFLLVSIAIAAYLKAAGADKMIAKVFSGHPIVIILVASVFGALSPFCSCGVIPLIAALLLSGVPLSAVMAFWLSSPVMSPDMFVLTAGSLGLEFAVAKTLGAISVGFLGGFGTMALQHFGAFTSPLKPERQTVCGNSNSVMQNDETIWRFWQDRQRVAIFGQEFKNTGIFLVQWLVFAFVLESLMVSYLPPGTISQILDPQSMFVIPIAALIGVPAYLNGYAAIPLASGLLNSGFSGGAVLTFMTAGAMTSIPAAIAVFSLVNKKVFFWYLFLALFGSVLLGFGYQLYHFF